MRSSKYNEFMTFCLFVFLLQTTSDNNKKGLLTITADSNVGNLFQMFEVRIDIVVMVLTSMTSFD